MAAGLLWSAAGTADPEKDMAAALHREVVLGDLRGALQRYGAIASQAGVAKPLAARALLHMAECSEKLGQEKEAYSIYRRLENEFVDQAAVLAVARGRLQSFVGPRNLKFEEGVVGKVPPGWRGPAFAKDTNYMADLQREGCLSKLGCAVVMAPVNVPGQVGTLMQSINAVPYRGKTVRLRAAVKLEQFFATPTGMLRSYQAEDRVQLWLRVVRTKERIGFSDQMDDRPVRSPEWTRCEITAPIDDDAVLINFGVMSFGGARAWIDDVSFEVIE